ncbi:hypothetical protein OUZ56_021174 [Daphnia magna]|uniref:Uncharacterized protein n=1 Tax=Daphnia magna TaxID=35525 RepID=A0ABQ9ZGL9_9CRUS|nr:hypothetical protein OUZ56_021174 [Daphnia magna]
MDLDVAESFEEIGETTTSLTIGFFIIRWPKREQKEKRVSNFERGTIHKGLNAYIGGRTIRTSTVTMCVLLIEKGKQQQKKRAISVVY